MSHFLGELMFERRATNILSASELIAREGVDLKKGMNFRKERGMFSVFLVLPSHDGEYKDAWDPETEVYTFEGHDSKTVDAGGKSPDQLLMYGSGKLTDNGIFYKAATEYAEGLRSDPLQIQVYEKLDTGAWFDKGFFNLIYVRRVREDGRVLFKFDLQSPDAGRADRTSVLYHERMLSATAKAAIWKRDNGRCTICGAESGLRFVPDAKDSSESSIHLRCATCRGEGGGMLG